MGKDIRKKVRGDWWYGWVKFAYYDQFDQVERTGVWRTNWEFATSGQAHRAAQALAGGMTAPQSPTRYDRSHRSKNDPSRQSRYKVIETGATRAGGKTVEASSGEAEDGGAQAH